MWWAFAGPDSSERLLRWGTVGFAMACALFCAIGPMVQMRRQRARGDILVYEPGTETLKLPREGLVLKRGQVIEFRILQECISPEPGTIPLVPERLTQGSTGAAELQLVYQNPNQRICTLLRADGSFLFREVIGALKSARIAKVLLVEQQPSLKDWQAREA
jgi:hypothetical protein